MTPIIMRRTILLITGWLTAVSVALAQNFPPPTEFRTGYTLPSMTTPPPRVEWLGWVDVGVLVLALGLATYFALRARSRRGMLAVTVGSLLYFGFYRHGCICPVGAVQNVALALTSTEYALPLTVGLFFGLPLLFALFAGRVFCAGVCPLGAIQELVLMRPLTVPKALERALGMLPFVYLGLAVLLAATGSGFLICRFDPFVLFFRLHGSALMLWVGIGTLLVSTVIGRPYCRFLCPYGALLRLLAPLAQWRPQITPGQCVQCRLCESACPYGAIAIPTPPLSETRRQRERRVLLVSLVLLPVCVAGGWVLGGHVGPILARQHPTVRVAEQLWLRTQGMVTTETLELTAVDHLGVEEAPLLRAGVVKQAQIVSGSRWWGAWCGLVVGLALIGAVRYRRREVYEIEPEHCVACGRCYAACPVNQEHAVSVSGDECRVSADA
jgi:NosR/NirI family nitrous oxide reductase transcriptional regulator